MTHVTNIWLLPGGAGIGIRKADGTVVEYTAAQIAEVLDDIDTAAIADGAVTAAKLASNAVETAKIKDANVTNTKLAADCKVGSLATLTTTEKASLVGAINELVTRVAALEAG